MIEIVENVHVCKFKNLDEVTLNKIYVVGSLVGSYSYGIIRASNYLRNYNIVDIQNFTKGNGWTYFDCPTLESLIRRVFSEGCRVFEFNNLIEAIKFIEEKKK